MQRGTIRKHHGAWTLFYYDTVLQNGQRIRKKVSKKLADVSDEYPTDRSVWSLADKILAPLNAGTQVAESSMTVLKFIEDVYLPHVKHELRPSTYKDYNDILRVHLKSKLNGIRLRDFRTLHGQRLMREITGVGHASLLRIKSFLSGTFKHARREGFIDSENPMRDVSAPGRPKKFRGPVYSMEDIENIATAVAKKDMKAFTVISVAAFTGLRLSELRGLRWKDYDGESLFVGRSVWRTVVNETKTESSEAPVPVLPLLQRILNEHRTRVNGQPEQYIFAGERRGVPLNLANLARRVILPALAEASDMQQAIPWHGWHAFRRSLATNLLGCRVEPKIIQQILRHSNIATTMDIYVQPPDTEARAALKKIEDLIGSQNGSLEMSQR
jgi:integrase